MCHERWWSFYRPWLERPSKIAPQPMREASVFSILRRHEAPNMGPWDRNQGFFHIIEARRHRHVTLIMRKGLPLGENPLVLSHHCRGLMCNSPKGIALDAAAIRPNSLWNYLTVSDWPSLILSTADRMKSIRASDRRSCIDVESHITRVGYQKSSQMSFAVVQPENDKGLDKKLCSMLCQKGPDLSDVV